MVLMLVDGRQYGWTGENRLYIAKSAKATNPDGTTIFLKSSGLENPYEFDVYRNPRDAVEAFRQHLWKEIKKNSYWSQNVLFELKRLLPFRTSHEIFYLVCWHSVPCNCHGSVYLSIVQNWERIQQKIKEFDDEKERQRIALLTTKTTATDNTLITNISEPLPQGNDMTKNTANAITDTNTAKLVEIDTSVFTDDQLSAYQALQHFLTNDDKQIIVTGGGGVGKSYLMSKFAEYVTNQKKSIVACTPTHKAAKVLRAMLKNSNVRCNVNTLHQYLTIVPDKNKRNNKTGERAFGETYRSGLNVNCDIAILDESSMYRDHEYNSALRHLPKIIWVGDDAQLPPISDPPIETSAPFRWGYKNPKYINELLEVVRYSGSVLDYCQALRRNIKSGDITIPPTSKYLSNDGTFRHHNDPTMWRIKAVELFQQYPNEFTKVRVVAYRVNTVDEINRFFRLVIFGEEAQYSKFLPGEHITVGWREKDVRTPIVRAKAYSRKAADKDEYLSRYSLLSSPSRTNRYVEMLTGSYLENHNLYHADDDFIVEDVDVSEEDNLLWYFLTVRDEYGLTRTLKTIHESSEEAYMTRYRKLVEEARREEIPWDYVEAWQFLNDNVTHCYAVTANSAQGSTYEHCFVDGTDILNNRHSITERNKRYYVAVSRTGKQLNLYC